jgi:hypothetical protein
MTIIPSQQLTQHAPAAMNAHGPHTKHHAQQSFYCCLCMLYLGIQLIEPMPNFPV